MADETHSQTSQERLKVRYILTDIEGTTSDIAFVRDVLFPYAAQHLPRFIREYEATPEVRRELDAVAHVAQVARVDQESGRAAHDVEALIETLLDWIRADQKVTPLKALQGQVWRHGYQEGHFKGHLYPDAYQELTRWREIGITLGVYSSGSVEAQKLLFGYSDFGDLTPLFSDYFDTRVGHKREAPSYDAIACTLIERDRVQRSAEILFLSDVVAELDAARASGMQTCELRRDDASRAQAHQSVSRFTELDELFLLSGHA